MPPGVVLEVKRPETYGMAGEWFRAHGQAGCAVAIYRHGLALAPDSAPLHAALGTALLSQGNAKGAQSEMAEAVHLEPDMDAAWLMLGVLAHDRGDLDTALKDWQRAAQLNPNATTALDWIAKTRMEAGQYTEAMDLLRTAPATEDLVVDEVMAGSRSASLEEGLNAGKRALAVHSTWRRLRMALVTVLVQRNRYEEALALLRAAPPQDLASTELQVLTLRVLLLTGDSSGATPVAEALQREEPGSFDALYLRGLLLRQQGDYAAALPLLQQAVALAPQHFDAHFNLGIALDKLHRAEEAKAILLQAAKLPEATPEVHFQLAGVLRETGDPATARSEMAMYREQLARRAERDQRLNLAAQAASKLQSGDNAGAAAVERQILSADPLQASHWYDLALALDKLGDLPGETAALEHAVALQPNFAVAWNQLGYLRARAGAFVTAQEAFQHAIAAAPQYAEAENNLGSLLAESGRDNDAVPHFRAALAANPRLVEGWINLAASLAASDDFAEARRAANRALAVQPGNPEAQRLLAMLPPEAQARQR